MSYKMKNNRVFLSGFILGQVGPTGYFCQSIHSDSSSDWQVHWLTDFTAVIQWAQWLGPVVWPAGDHTPTQHAIWTGCTDPCLYSAWTSLCLVFHLLSGCSRQHSSCIDTIHHDKMALHDKFTFGLLIWKPENKSHALMFLLYFVCFFPWSHYNSVPTAVIFCSGWASPPVCIVPLPLFCFIGYCHWRLCAACSLETQWRLEIHVESWWVRHGGRRGGKHCGSINNLQQHC